MEFSVGKRAPAGWAVAVLLSLLRLSAGQESLAITLQLQQCSALRFFDISTLQCTECPSGTFPSSDQRVCIGCDTSTGQFYDFRTGLAITQNWTEALAQSSTSCACRTPVPSRTLLATAWSNGLRLQRCVVCPAGTSVSGTGGTTCVPDVPPPSLPPTPNEQLTQALIQLSITGVSAAAATQASIPVPSSSGGTLTLTVSQSQPLVELLGPSALSCLQGLGADRAACNAVANLCALQLYDPAVASCRMYTELVRRLGGGNTGGGTAANRNRDWRPDTGPMPWLFYGGTDYVDDPNLDLRVQFSGGSLDRGEVSLLTFVLSSYLLNGTWLGYNQWTSQFQLCGAPKNDGSRWYRYGYNYVNACSIKLEMLLADVAAAFTGAGDTVVHELFLQVGTQTLYPIPVKVTNADEARQSSANEGAVRRFFFVDKQLGYSAQSRALQAVQYPTSVYLEVMQRDSPRDKIYVPQLTISYSGWQTTSTSTVGLDATATNTERHVSFWVRYVNNGELEGKFWYAWQTILIVYLVVLAFPAMMLAVFRYMRKKRDQADLDFLLYAGVCVCDYGSFALALVLLTVTLYYLTLYKLQEEAFFLMLPDWQLYNFRVTVILAIVGQCVGIVYTIFMQIRTDVFFIDWEKSRKVLSKEGAKEEPSPVSAWRMLMVANEWNELQTVRVTYPPFTLLMMVMILVGANVYTSGQVTPDANDYNNYFGVTTSIILRMGIEAFFFLVLFIGQYLWKKLIYYPYVHNPITQFIDLMYLANISTVLFDDSHGGYYLHGRNMAQHSDTTLRELNQELLKEEEGLTAHRGLVSSSANPKLADNQAFLMYVTDSIRKTYDAKMLQLVQQATNDARNRKGSVSTFLRGTGRQSERVLSAQQDIGLLFKQMVEDVERNQATQVIDPTYTQMVLQLPPDAAVNNPAFVHDYFNTFTTTMFLGCEVRLYVFEAVFFCAVDMSLGNVAVTALLTFLVNRALTWFRAAWGEDNLSRKTLVDRHFLI